MTQSHVGQPPRPATFVRARVHAGPVERPEPPPNVVVEPWQNIENLLRQELALANAALELKIERMEREAAAFGAGAVLILAGLLTLAATIVLLLSHVMPAWVAALLTSGATTAVGFTLVQFRWRR